MDKYPVGWNVRRGWAVTRRIAASQIVDAQPQHPAASNGDNVRYSALPMAFGKGLAHGSEGLIEPQDYAALASALTGTGADGTVEDPAFAVPTAERRGVPTGYADGNGKPFGYRLMESPLAGLYFENQGPDPDATAMAPSPKLGESELCAEIAELYAMSLVRDMAFSDLQEPASRLSRADGTILQIKGRDATVGDLIAALNALSWFGAREPVSTLKGSPGLSLHETRRRDARFDEGEKRLTASSLFRGSSPGCKAGPYVSQFLLQGGGTMGVGGDNLPADEGLLAFGAQTIDQRIFPAKSGIDYMTDWRSWRYVQNGVNFRGWDTPDRGADGSIRRKFIATPRDLGAYVHIDALYQAYFVACLLLLNDKTPVSQGFPDRTTREGFATFGGPHILSLMTEVATRGLRAVRRQKFQIHRRARPEKLAAMLTLAVKESKRLGDALPAFQAMMAELGVDGSPTGMTPLMAWIDGHNVWQNSLPRPWMKGQGDGQDGWEPAVGGNYLLPMAFPEGSPMHPAYGAGHATVAGACTTILKAFFAIYEASDPARLVPRPLGAQGRGGLSRVFRSMDAQGQSLEELIPLDPLTTEGELNKLAANIGIGRNLAGVHYYTDYYDSLRLGERVAVGVLIEHLLACSEPVAMHLRGFDGESLHLSTRGTGKTGDVVLAVNGTHDRREVAAWWTHNTAEFPQRSAATFDLAMAGTSLWS